MSMTRKLSQCTFAQWSTPLLKTKPQTNQKTNSNPNPKPQPQPNLKKKKTTTIKCKNGARTCPSFCILHVYAIKHHV